MVSDTIGAGRLLRASALELSDDRFLKAALLAEFQSSFGPAGGSARVFAAPARINLIGEHIDYNGGQVFPVALDKCLYLAIRQRADDVIVIRNLQLPGEYRRSLAEAGASDADTGFALYIDGMLAGLRAAGATIDHGFEALLFSTVPMGAGVSSSAALELCFGVALSSLYNFTIDRLELVKLAQKAEHDFVGVQCGIMDQFAVAFGRRGQAMLLDTASLVYQYVPLELGDFCIVLMNSNFPRALAGSKYNERRAECDKALALLRPALAVNKLCAIRPEQFDRQAGLLVDPVLLRRARHCVYENERVRRSVEALRAGDLVRFGELMKQSHLSLRDDYEVTSPALDALFDAASGHEACLGARMTGAGFGGCVIALVKRADYNEFSARVGQAYTALTGLVADFYMSAAGDGARELA
ncbi:MAG: galactokinase [Spirochaetes bacterium GWD1_61_31]|nr:MAG: galactokinase [Spirochaetes bacterium GWB1_60_80]OHD28482.1 MAG: galactokinase [Spirochaetes bacterium GWC1_61_12]OHD40098.1 MAG: galactokinase [Spirochaetes bacterium GWD1_61_31]OHD45854.1 MAG: galactokinase [Spirochaetes bacterium GWE1_60_18]OHD58397.1 MAG: galactokinase [Spirochaetes bacterium GWF1_60_12]